jgi:prevent-host-death family protein
MSISIAQSRQQLSALISAAQVTPQVITKRNKAVAVLVSAEYFERSAAAVTRTEGSFFKQLVQLRAANAPQDDDGIPSIGRTGGSSWSRTNPFTDGS